MNYLYVITAKKSLGYDGYIGAVVCATSEDEARRIHPSGHGWIDNRDNDGEWYSRWDWMPIEAVDAGVNVQRLGVADASLKAGDVLLDSFLAG